MNTPLSCSLRSLRNADWRAFWCCITALPWICWMWGPTPSITLTPSQLFIRWEYERKMQVSGMRLHTPSIHLTSQACHYQGPILYNRPIREGLHDVLVWRQKDQTQVPPERRGFQLKRGFIFQTAHHFTALLKGAPAVQPQWAWGSCLFETSYINFWFHHSWQMLLTGTQPNTSPSVCRSSLHFSSLLYFQLAHFHYY